MRISRVMEAVAEFAGQAGIIDLIVCAAGAAVLAVWLLKTSLGTKSLVDSPARRNNMRPFLALLPFFLWFVTVSVLAHVKGEVLADLPDWQDVFANNLILCVGVVPPVGAIVIIARACFARGLSGLGLNPGTIVRDLAAALLNLLAVWPVVLAMVVLTILAGRFIVGPTFEMPRHEELKHIIAHPQWQVVSLIIFTTIVVVPVTEEMLFRGMFQTVLRSHLEPWPAVFFASLIFVMFHENPQHWPSLFALSMCLGYAYEKSGSLFRPIFIHSFFNALSVFAALGR